MRIVNRNSVFTEPGVTVPDEYFNYASQSPPCVPSHACSGTPTLGKSRPSSHPSTTRSSPTCATYQARNLFHYPNFYHQFKNAKNL